MRLFWRILAALAGLLLLLVIAVAIAIRTVDVNDFASPIAQRVKDATGRDLAIKGRINLRMSLEPTLVIDDVTLGNASWAKSPQMLSARRVEAQVALLPLLQRRFEVVHLTLVEPTIALETDAHGKGNWELQPVRSGSAGATADGATANAFAIGDLAIRDGTLTYRDGETNKLTNVVIESLALHARDASSPVSARFRGKVDDLAIALEGDLGPLDALTQRRLPYPVALKGEINGKSATLTTKVRVERQGVNLDELQLGLGQSSMSGQISTVTGEARRRIVLKIDAPRLALADLPLANKASAGRAQEAAARAARDAHLFVDVALPLDALRASDVDGDIGIGELLLENGRHVDHVRMQFTVRDGKFAAPLVHMSAFGGSLDGRIDLDASPGHDPVLTLRLEAKSLDTATLLAATGSKREIRGGKTDVKVDLVARGDSPRKWASSATGNVVALVGPTTLGNTRLDVESPLTRLSEAVNPFFKIDPSTDLQCAVARLPLKNGVAQIDRSIAFETTKYGASASGSIDFRDETLDLAIKPQVREGVQIKVPQIAELVRFRGPFKSPAVAVDAVGTATTVARIGAAVYTGGLSILGESLISSASASGGNLCHIALGRSEGREIPAASAAPAKPGVPVLGDIGKAIGKAFHR
jgi:AsmA family protein